MEKEEYLAYIAHFVDAISPVTPKYEYREYFASVLGDDLFDSDIKELKSLARHLYKAYVVSVYSRHNAFVLASKLSDSQLEKYLEGITELDKKYKIDYKPIDRDLKLADSHIKKSGERKWKFILGKIDPKNSPTVIREAARKAREAKSKTRSKSTSAKKTVTKPRSKSPVKTTVKPRSKSPVKTSTKKTSKTCDQHNLKELKEIAKSRGMSGYSKLAKADLCKMLKIK